MTLIDFHSSVEYNGLRKSVTFLAEIRGMDDIRSSLCISSVPIRRIKSLLKELPLLPPHWVRNFPPLKLDPPNKLLRTRSSEKKIQRALKRKISHLHSTTPYPPVLTHSRRVKSDAPYILRGGVTSPLDLPPRGVGGSPSMKGKLYRQLISNNEWLMFHPTLSRCPHLLHPPTRTGSLKAPTEPPPL